MAIFLVQTWDAQRREFGLRCSDQYASLDMAWGDILWTTPGPARIIELVYRPIPPRYEAPMSPERIVHDVRQPLPEVPAEGYCRVTVTAGVVFDAPRDLADQAGWRPYAGDLTGKWDDGHERHSPYQLRALTALSEGRAGLAILLRALELDYAERLERAAQGTQRAVAAASTFAADKAVHAARIQRQIAGLKDE